VRIVSQDFDMAGVIPDRVVQVYLTRKQIYKTFCLWTTLSNLPSAQFHTNGRTLRESQTEFVTLSFPATCRFISALDDSAWRAPF